MTDRIPDQFSHLPLIGGNQWRRLSDGETVTIKWVAGRNVWYRFPSGGSNVTRISRFVRQYIPVEESSTPKLNAGKSDRPGTGSQSATPDCAPGSSPAQPDTL